ncbi:MAG: hypothetical protein LAN84_13985 [Acidobacteriia bacterium]|nr:hypothetical protein [Terriglobia bacterium]
MTLQRNVVRFLAVLFFFLAAGAAPAPAQQPSQNFDPQLFSELRWRSIGPHRGGRAVAITGAGQQRLVHSVEK